MLYKDLNFVIRLRRILRSQRDHFKPCIIIVYKDAKSKIASNVIFVKLLFIKHALQITQEAQSMKNFQNSFLLSLIGKQKNESKKIL